MYNFLEGGVLSIAYAANTAKAFRRILPTSELWLLAACVGRAPSLAPAPRIWPADELLDERNDVAAATLETRICRGSC